MDSDVTIFSPRSSPRVSDDPELISASASVSDQSDTVVESGSASALLHDTSLVEGPSSGVDGDGDDSLVDGRGKGLLAVGDIDESADLDGWGSLGLASSVSGGVWVVAGELESVVLDVLESVVHQTSVTSVVSVAGGAVDELLFGQVEELTLGLEPGTFESTVGRESPAGTARSLVFDWVDGTLFSPIDGTGLGNSVRFVDDVVSWSLGESVTEHLGSEFLIVHVGELVEFHSPGELLSVVSGDLLVVLVEDAQSVDLLGWGSVVSSGLGRPSLESSDNVLWNGSLFMVQLVN